MKENVALNAFMKFGDTVLRVAFSYTGRMSDAEDITQDVFLTLHSKPVEFSNDEHMKAWLLRVTVNKCRNFRKSSWINGRIETDSRGLDVLSCSMSADETELLDIVMTLPEKYRTVLYLYYYEGYSIKEIAGILKKNENTVSSLLQRARAKMKSKLEEE